MAKPTTNPRADEREQILDEIRELRNRAVQHPQGDQGHYAEVIEALCLLARAVVNHAETTETNS